MDREMDDDELTAMQSLLAALQPLDAPGRVRVLRWGWERFGDDIGELPTEAPFRRAPSRSESELSDAAQLVEAAGASSGPQRALCVAYFIQEVSGRPGFSGQEVNSTLKNLGHPLANVTKTLSDLRAQKPSLVMQVSKAGRAPQARKTYRLTTAGVERVRQMLRAARTEGSSA